MDTPAKLPAAKKTIAEQQLDAAKQLQAMFEGDVAKRQAHFDTLTDDEEKRLYGAALKTAKKSADDQKAHVARAQKALDATDAAADSNRAADASTTAETES